MSRRAVALLLVLFGVSGAGAFVADSRLEQLISSEQSAVAAIDRERAVLIGTTLEAEREATSDGSASRRDRHQARAVELKMWETRLHAASLILLGVIAGLLGWGAVARVTPAAASTAEMLRNLPPAVKAPGAAATNGTAGVSGAGAASAGQTANGLATPTSASGQRQSPGAQVPQPPALPLAAAAELCVDLARVASADQLPALLERVATVLDARGIVLWAADASGAMLRPSMAHGYPDKVLQRLRAIQVDADNVTSLAYRSTEPQIITSGAGADSGALAVPLIGSDGCVGVLSIELRQGRSAGDVLPVARIIGAQFSTLFVPTAAVPERAAASDL